MKQMESPLRLFLCISLTMASLCAAEDLSKKTINLLNNCSFPVWPGITPGNVPAGFPPILKPGESQSVTFAFEWKGYIWGRFGCSFDQSERGSCISGDCGGFLRCEKAPAEQEISTPITRASFANGTVSLDLLYGYNLPISVVPVTITGDECKERQCRLPAARICSKCIQIKVKDEVIGCKGECDTYTALCTPDEFYLFFKAYCSDFYPFHDGAFCPSTTNYNLTFCPV